MKIKGYARGQHDTTTANLDGLPPNPVLLKPTLTPKPKPSVEIHWNTISSPCHNQFKEKTHQTFQNWMKKKKLSKSSK